MSFISLWGIFVGLLYSIGVHLSLKNIEKNNIKIITQIIHGFYLGFILCAIILLWKTGPGLYGIRFWN